MSIQTRAAGVLDAVFERAAILLLPVLVAGVAVLFYLRLYLQLPLAIGFLLGTVVYLLLRWRANATDRTGRAFDATFGDLTARQSTKLAVAVALLLVAAAILSLATTTYDKPLVYYPLVALAVGALAVSPKRDPLWWLGVVPTGAVILGSSQLVFPTGIGGIDHYYHVSQVIDPILASGHVPQQTRYGQYPLHHVTVAVLSDLALPWLPSRRAYYMAVALVLVLIGPFVYVVVRTVLESYGWTDAPARWAAIAVLLYYSSDFVVRYATIGNHLVFAGLYLVGFFAVVLTLYVRSSTGASLSRRGRVPYVVLALLLYLTLLATHHYTVVILLTLAVPVVLFGGARSTSEAVLWVGLLGVATLLHWGWIAQQAGLGLVVANVLPLIMGLGVASPTQATTSQPVWIVVYTTLGVSLLLALTQIGLLATLEEGETVRDRLLPVVCYGFFALMAVGVVAGLKAMSPNRMLFFAEFTLLPVFAVVGLSRLEVPRRAVTVGVLVMVFAALALTGVTPGIETSPIGESIAHNKKFETAEENAVVAWSQQFVTEERRVRHSASFVEYESGTVGFRSELERSTLGATRVTMDKRTFANPSLSDREVLLYSESDRTVGYKLGGWESRRFGSGRYVTLSDPGLHELEVRNNRIYDAGATRVYAGVGSIEDG